MAEEKGMWVGQYDLSDPEKVRKHIKTTFDDKRRSVFEFVGNPVHLDMDQKRYDRRMDAAIRCVQQAKEITAEDYPDYPGTSYFEEDWAYLNTVINTGYDWIDNDRDLILGAAIWILETLDRHDKLYLTDDLIMPGLTDKAYAERYAAEAIDLTFSDSLVSKTVYALMNRNDDIKIYGKKGGIKRNILDEATVRRKQHVDVPSRRNYEKLIGMIPEEEINKAVDEFRSLYWQLACILFAGLKNNHEERDTLLKRHDRLLRKRNRYSEEDLKAGERNLRQDSIKKKFISNLENVLELDQAIMRIAEQAEMNVSEKRNMVELLHEYHVMNSDEKEEYYSSEFNERMKDFHIKDPYMICFALLYLADHDDDLIWNYYFGTALVSLAADLLPWREGYDELFVRGLKTRHADDPYEDIAADFMKLQYEVPEDTEDPYEERISYNLSQILYMMTGMILPRDMDTMPFLDDWFKELNIPEGERKVMRACVSLLETFSQRNPDDYAVEKEEEKPVVHSSDLHERNKELERQIVLLQKENKRIKESSWMMQKHNAVLTEKLEKIVQETEADRNELHRLREVIFASQSQEEPAPDKSIKLPVEAKERIIVAGGHDTFVKQFSQLITGNIRFTNNARVNEELLRNASMVWIQTNAISHSEYYKTMDICRKNNIPVYYFLYASARKCAEQVAAELKKSNHK